MEYAEKSQPKDGAIEIFLKGNNLCFGKVEISYYRSLNIIIVIFLATTVYIRRNRPAIMAGCLGLISGAGASNSLEGVIRGTITDFIDYYIGICNTADVIIFLASFILLALMMPKK